MSTRLMIASCAVLAALAPAQSISLAPAEFAWSERAVTGKPYSAESSTETVQTLADGNRIVRKNTSRLFRDPQGRTRREQSIEVFGVNSATKAHEIVTIQDPVAKAGYSLDPTRRVARKIPSGMPAPIELARTARSGGPEPDVRAGMVFETSVKVAQGTLPAPGAEPQVLFFEAGPARPGSAPPANVVLHDTPAGGPPALETLGARTIEGLECTGTRRTLKIPAGLIGNDREIVTVTEEWYSPRLEMVVQSKTSDPRFGETLRRVSNIRLEAPAAELFQVPAGYTIEEPRAVPGPAIRLRE